MTVIEAHNFLKEFAARKGDFDATWNIDLVVDGGVGDEPEAVWNIWYWRDKEEIGTAGNRVLGKGPTISDAMGQFMPSPPWNQLTPNSPASEQVPRAPAAAGNALESVMIDLEEFCCDESRPGLDTSSPFVRGGWKYATDGRIAVRIPAPDDLDSKASLKQFPPCQELFEDYTPMNLQPWPEVRYCPQCFDTGMIGCDGSACECGECAHSGCGIRKCLLCNGRNPSGQIIKSNSSGIVIVGSHLIAVEYHYQISTLPNVKFDAGVTDYQEILPFIFDGGEGRIMGCMKV